MERLTLTTADRVQVQARFFPAEAPVASVLLAPALGVPQQFYARFCTWLAERGVSSLTVDYRGVGDSAPPDLRGFKANLRAWGEDDLAAALDALSARAPGVPLVWIGHSFGGQALALAPVHGRIAGAVTVAAGFVHRRDWPQPRRAVFSSLLGVVGPTFGRLHGYVPGWLGIGADLPAGVIEEWGRWCLSERYLLDHVPGAGDLLAALGAPVVCYGIADDTYTPAASAARLASLIPGSAYRTLNPADVGLSRLGHFNLFRPGAEAGWQRLLLDVLDISEAAPRR